MFDKKSLIFQKYKKKFSRKKRQVAIPIASSIRWISIMFDFIYTPLSCLWKIKTDKDAFRINKQNLNQVYFVFRKLQRFKLSKMA